MSAQHTPGPWQIAEEVGAVRPFTCYRRRNGKSYSSLLESMKASDGSEARFATEQEARSAISLVDALARAAIAKATVGAP
jgi:hypothetical protein